jgi:hypothetical protein
VNLSKKREKAKISQQNQEKKKSERNNKKKKRNLKKWNENINKSDGQT